MQRLKTRPQFQAVLAGELVAKSSHFALHRLRLAALSDADSAAAFPQVKTWVGALAPKRWAKRAVTRNAVRRQIYAACTMINCGHEGVAFLVRLRREFSRRDFTSASSEPLKDAINTELRTLLQEHVINSPQR